MLNMSIILFRYKQFASKNYNAISMYNFLCKLITDLQKSIHFITGLLLGEGVQPHFCPWENVCFPILPHGEKWEKKYMEREGKVFISLSFHTLFPHFSPWEKVGKHSFFHGQKWGWTPPLLHKLKLVAARLKKGTAQ